MKLQYGDVFTSTARIIGQGVNCKGIMGKGIAKAFADRWPDMVKEYSYLCKNGILTPGGVHWWAADEGPGDGFTWVVNIASQNNLGKDAREAWLTAGLITASENAAAFGAKRIAIPAIGCGIGGLHIDALERAIAMAEDKVFKVEYELWLQ